MGRTVIFFRKEGFYQIQLSGLKSVAEEVADHVALNPGTLRVEDFDGDVIWPLTPKEDNHA